MAILNYALTLSEVLSHLNITNILDTASADLPKLFFTKEGDIITHGTNYLPLFNISTIGKGMVPVNTSTENKNLDFLKGDGSWGRITTADLPIWTSGNYNNDTILSSLQVLQLINNGIFIAADAMRFKGVVNSEEEITSPWIIGDTYRIGMSGDYFGKVGEAGDILICVTSGNSDDTDKNSHWTVVLTNLEGTTTIKLNNSAIKVYSNESGNFNNTYLIFGPTSNGYLNGPSGILIGANNVSGIPEWAGLLGLQIVAGSTSRILKLTPATTSNIGGVKIDSIAGSMNSEYSTVSVDTEGRIYLTKENIWNALGYIPTDPSTIPDAIDKATKEKDGLVPAYNGILGELSSNYWVLGVLPSGAGYGWYSMPEFTDTWRKISIGGIDIEDSELLLNPSGDVCITVDNDTSDKITSISFGLSWYNINTGAYETA